MQSCVRCGRYLLIYIIAVLLVASGPAHADADFLGESDVGVGEGVADSGCQFRASDDSFIMLQQAVEVSPHGRLSIAGGHAVRLAGSRSNRTMSSMTTMMLSGSHMPEYITDPRSGFMIGITLALGGVVVFLMLVVLVNLCLEFLEIGGQDPSEGGGSKLPPDSLEDVDIDCTDTPRDMIGARCSVWQTAANMMKCIVGQGLFSLPGMLVTGRVGLFTAAAWTLGTGFLMSYSVSLIGKVSSTTGGRTYKEFFKKLHSPIQAELMVLAALTLAWMGSLAEVMTLADSFSSFLHFCGFTGPIVGSRAFSLVLLAALVLLPLAVQNLSFLSYVSFAAMWSEVLVLMFMQYRYLDGSYAEGGRYYESTLIKQSSSITSTARDDAVNTMDVFRVSFGLFDFSGALLLAMAVHHNGPRFYTNLRNRSPSRFGTSTSIAFALVMALYLWVLFLGYLTFGSSSQGLIVNNYSEEDPLAAVARMVVSITVICTLPLSIVAVRDNGLAVLDWSPYEIRKETFYGCTFGILFVLVVLGILITDIGFTNSLAGVGSVSVILLLLGGIGCRCYFQQSSANSVKEADSISKLSAVDFCAFIILVVFGGLLLLVGCPVVVARKAL